MVRIQDSSGNLVTTTNRKRRRKQKRRTSRKAFVLFMLIAVLILTLMISPVFDITVITVEGNSKISSEDIIEASGLKEGVNIFKADLSKAKTYISMMPYVDFVTVKRVMPGTIKILIEESKPVAYIPFIGSYICIDSKGKIVEVFSKLEEIKLPVILGLKFSEFTIGQVIQAEDDKKMELVKASLKEIIHNDLLNQITEIDVNDVYNIRLKVRDKIDVNLGDGTRISFRMSFLRGILEQLEETDKGYIDLTNEDRVIFQAR